MSDEIKNTEVTEEVTQEPSKDLAPETENTENTPSIFDKPDHSNDKVKKKSPKWLVAVIALVLCAALVLSAIFIPKLLKKEDPTPNNTSSEEVTVTLRDFSKYTDTLEEVAELGKGGVENIVYTVDGFDFNIVQGEFTETSTDADGNPTETKRVGWTIDNYKGVQWNNNNVSGIVSNALKVTAITKLTDSPENLEMYGLDDKNVFSKVTVNFKNGESYTVLSGIYSSDRSGRYIKFADENTVYLSSYSVATYMSLSSTDMPQNTVLGRYESNGKDKQYFSDNELTYFDAMYMFGRSQSEIITFAPADTAETFTNFKMMKPVETPADDDAINEVFDVVKSGINAEGVLEFMPDDDTIKSYGLQFDGDDNYLKVLTVVAGVVYKLEIGNKLEDGCYPVMVNSARVIYSVPAEELPFINKKYSDFLRANLFLASISTMDRVTVSGDVNETFNITNILKDEENDAYDQIIKNGKGKLLDDAVFKDGLAYFQRLQATGFDNETYGNIDKKPSLTITISYSDSKKADTTVTFYQFSERRYLYKLDGGGNSLISLTEYRELVDKLNQAVKAVK